MTYEEALKKYKIKEKMGKDGNLTAEDAKKYQSLLNEHNIKPEKKEEPIKMPSVAKATKTKSYSGGSVVAEIDTDKVKAEKVKTAVKKAKKKKVVKKPKGVSIDAVKDKVEKTSVNNDGFQSEHEAKTTPYKHRPFDKEEPKVTPYKHRPMKSVDEMNHTEYYNYYHSKDYIKKHNERLARKQKALVEGIKDLASAKRRAKKKQLRTQNSHTPGVYDKDDVMTFAERADERGKSRLAQMKIELEHAKAVRPKPEKGKKYLTVNQWKSYQEDKKREKKREKAIRKKYYSGKLAVK